MKYYSVLTKRDAPSYNNMDESGGHYAKWNKPDTKRKKKKLHDFTICVI